MSPSERTAARELHRRASPRSGNLGIAVTPEARRQCRIVSAQLPARSRAARAIAAVRVRIVMSSGRAAHLGRPPATRVRVGLVDQPAVEQVGAP